MTVLSKILFITFFFLSLEANPVLTQYRFEGLHNIEKKMDLELSKMQYWEDYLQNIDTSFGYIESYTSILTCNKEKSTLNLYKKNKNKKFILSEEFHAFTGEKKGDKYKEGDLRTPVGIYNITKRISKLDSFYGPLAFVTSYPNLYDKFRNKDGSGIWIHGLPINQERDDYTKGCIAINNDNIVSLDRKIDINTTMLIINPKSEYTTPSKNILAKLLSGLYTWRYAWIYNDTKSYLSFYSKKFVRNDGMKYKDFIKYKTRIFNKNEVKKILFNNINVIPYPNSTNTFQVTFREFYHSDSFQFEGDKVLVIKLINKDIIQILTER